MKNLGKGEQRKMYKKRLWVKVVEPEVGQQVKLGLFDGVDPVKAMLVGKKAIITFVSRGYVWVEVESKQLTWPTDNILEVANDKTKPKE